MNRIDITVEGVQEPKWLSRIPGFCIKVMEELSLDNKELSIVFCNNQFIRELNHRFRGKDEPTDVLSFSQCEGDETAVPFEGLSAVGDIVISLEMIEETKSEFQVEPEEELRRLLIHGILHLCGLDHEGDSSDRRMLVIQEELLEKLSEERIF